MTCIGTSRRYTFSKQQPASGSSVQIDLPGGEVRWAKLKMGKEALLSVYTRMNPEQHGNEYYHGLSLQHLPWPDESQLFHPYDTANEAFLAAEAAGRIRIHVDEHFTVRDLEDVVRQVRALDKDFFAQHNLDVNGNPVHDPEYDALNAALNLEQSLTALLYGADDVAQVAWRGRPLWSTSLSRHWH